MASGNIIWKALLWAALTLTSPLKAQEVNEDFLSPEVMELTGETKNYIAIINWWRIDTYTFSSERFVWAKPECRKIDWWWETYVLKWNVNLETLVKDNPKDPIMWSKLTYLKSSKTWDCNEDSSKSCTLSIKDFADRIKQLTTSKSCWENLIAQN